MFISIQFLLSSSIFWLCLIIGLGMYVGKNRKNQRSLHGMKERGSPINFQIIVKLDNNPITMLVDRDRTVKSVINEIQEKNPGQSIHDHRLMYKDKLLKDAQTMAECGITVGNKGVTPVLHLSGSYGFPDYYSNIEEFDPQFDRDFRNEKDEDKKYYRGGHEYHRPYGSMRYAIKVIDKYQDIDGKPDNNWIKSKNSLFLSLKYGLRKRQNDEKMLEQRAGDPEEGWPVAYHGTSIRYVISIIKNGFRVGQSPGMYGRGIYLTPYPETALGYAHTYEYNGRTYKQIIQSRVDPQNVEALGDNYWLAYTGDAVRPYGICVYEIEKNNEENN